MSLFHAINHNITKNPVQHRERISLERQRGKWFWRISLSLTALLFAIPILWGFGNHFYDALNITMILLVISNIIVYVLMSVRAVQYGSDTMARERRGKTWDLLMLTGISNWRVVLGKWLGIMRYLSREALWLYVVRAGTLIWASVIFYLQATFTYSELNPSYYGDAAGITVLDARIGGLWLLAGLLFAALMTVLELMFSSSIGLAVGFFNLRSKLSNALGSLIRIGIAILIPVIAYFVLAYGDGDRYIYRIDTDYYGESALTGIGRAVTFFADNGMVTAAALVSGDIAEIDSSLVSDPTAISIFVSFVIANLIGIAVYLAFTATALSFAANRSFARGLDHTRGVAPKVKVKRDLAAEPAQSVPSTPVSAQTIQIEHGQTNIFKFDNPEQLAVELYSYQRRLGRMILRINGGDAVQYIQLSNVAYMDAPAFWKSAAFYTGSQDDYEALLTKKDLYINGLTAESMRLYIVDSATPIHIIAGSAQLLEELPANL